MHGKELEHGFEHEIDSQKSAFETRVTLIRRQLIVRSATCEEVTRDDAVFTLVPRPEK